MFKRHPVDNPRITYGFGAKSDAWGQVGHLGIDYPGYEGQPIYAPADGTVVWARGSAAAAGNIWEQIPGSGNNGNCIIINHGPADWATHTLYAHLSAITTKEGQRVRAGQLIGHMGNTGYSFGTHLHWEMFIDYMEGQYPAGTFYGRVNPLDYFDVVTRIPVAPGASGGTSTSKELFSMDQYAGLMAKLQEAVNQTNKALSEATNAKVAANEARDLARKALSEATNAKVAAREAAARSAAVTGGSGASADAIVDELAARLTKEA